MWIYAGVGWRMLLNAEEAQPHHKRIGCLLVSLIFVLYVCVCMYLYII